MHMMTHIVHPANELIVCMCCPPMLTHHPQHTALSLPHHLSEGPDCTAAHLHAHILPTCMPTSLLTSHSLFPHLHPAHILTHILTPPMSSPSLHISCPPAFCPPLTQCPAMSCPCQSLLSLRLYHPT